MESYFDFGGDIKSFTGSNIVSQGIFFTLSQDMMLVGSGRGSPLGVYANAILL